MKKISEHGLLIVLALPFVCMGLAFVADGSWQAVVLGACSGMLLGGLLRRLMTRGMDLIKPDPRFSQHKTKPTKEEEQD